MINMLIQVAAAVGILFTPFTVTAVICKIEMGEEFTMPAKVIIGCGAFVAMSWLYWLI